ncbi:MAG: EVE domain-containing protein [Bdellovibrionales bacterium]|nr:EVE domain-containing protein [Bdellovibrionales bacterium]
MMAYWLFKTEPDVFSIDDLRTRKNKTEHWDGVRNYQARNFMRDEIKLGDLVLIYHSNARPPGIAGVAEVIKEAYPDHTQFDKKSKYFDPKSTKDKPRWFMVDIRFKEKFKSYISLDELKNFPQLKEMLILRKGNRLSITPVDKKHFEFIKKHGNLSKSSI